MYELVVVSGKGGTGKTSLSGAFAASAKNVVVCDADVDAADLYLLLQPEVKRKTDFFAGRKAVIAKERCVECGVCRELCRFGAISEDHTVDEILCEGCGVCRHFCPQEAVEFPENRSGEWYLSETRFGPMVHAALEIAGENSGKLVTLVRREARKIAVERGSSGILTDGPPGIGCPVIASLGGATATLVVTEPTPSGKHDLERVAALAGRFRVPVMVCVNKADLCPETAAQIEAFCVDGGHRFMGCLPFDPTFTRAQMEGKTVPEYAQGSPLAILVAELWERVHGICMELSEGKQQ